MKKSNIIFFITILFAVSYSEFVAQNFWKQIQSPTIKTLRNIFFVDSLHGWASGESGTVIRTTDGGSTWKNLTSNTDTTIWAIHFINENSGWMVSWHNDSVFNGSLIHKTTNGGGDWITEEFPGEDTYIQTIYFLDSLNGFAGKSYSPVREPIYYTSNGGTDWNTADIFPDTLNYPYLPVKKFYSISPQIIFACGGAIDIAGVIWKSSDSGVSWTADSTVAPDPINELHLFDSLEAIGIGGDQEFFYGIGLVRTTDGGVFWDYNELKILGVANSMDFRTTYEGWASLGFTQTFIYSVDSGYTWKEIPTPDNTEINDIIFIDSTKGFAVGKDGVILKYEYEPNSVNDGLENQPGEFFLFQNYPNPFNPVTNFRFRISSASGGEFVSLKVYDVLGNEIAVLVNEEKSPGDYEIEFSAKGRSASGGNAYDLSSGVYYYRLAAGENISVRKMIVLK